MINIFCFLRDGLKLIIKNKFAVIFCLIFLIYNLLYLLIPNIELVTCGINLISLVVSFFLTNGFLLLLWNESFNIKLSLQETISGIGNKIGEILWVEFVCLLIFIPILFVLMFLYHILFSIHSTQSAITLITALLIILDPIAVFAILGVITTKKSFLQIISNSISLFFRNFLRITLITSCLFTIGILLRVFLVCMSLLIDGQDPQIFLNQLHFFAPFPPLVSPFVNKLTSALSEFIQYPLQIAFMVLIYKKYNKPHWVIDIEDKQIQESSK